MKHGICAIFLLMSLAMPVATARSSSAGPAAIGPRTHVQADHGFREIQSALSNGHWKTLFKKSSVWIARYPANPNAPAVFRARSIAARALRDWKSCLNALREEKGLFPSQVKHEEFIATHLALRQWTEAKLLLTQLPAGRAKDLLQVRLDLEEGRLAEATTLLTKSRAATDTGYSPEARSLESEALELEHRLKLLECGRLPSDTPVEEGLLRDQLDRKSLCLHEAFQILQRLQKTQPGDQNLLYRDEVRARITEQQTSQAQADEHWKRDCGSPFHYLPSFRSGRSSLSAFEQSQVQRFFEPICRKFVEQRARIQGAGPHVEPNTSH